MTERFRSSKRRLLRIALLGVVGAAGRSFYSFADGGKMSKQQAEYQDTPKGIAMCATCTLFVAPHTCKVVEGEVSPDGWCKVYAMAD
jgi:hypothetical protein